MRRILWPSPHTEIENCCRIYPLSWFPEFDYWPEAQTRKVMCLTCVWYESGHIYTANVISSLQWKGDWKPDPICTVHQCSQTKEPIYEKESFLPQTPKNRPRKGKNNFSPRSFKRHKHIFSLPRYRTTVGEKKKIVEWPYLGLPLHTGERKERLHLLLFSFFLSLAVRDPRYST